MLLSDVYMLIDTRKHTGVSLSAGRLNAKRKTVAPARYCGGELEEKCSILQVECLCRVSADGNERLLVVDVRLHRATAAD
jgi:hypothetical protein